MAVPTALRPLRHRSFAIILLAGATSNIGSWMETVAVGSLVKSATGKDTLVAIAALAAFLPIGLLSPVGGALADRLDRRRFLITMNCFEAGVAAALATTAFTGHATPLVVTGLVFLEGCSAALRIPFQQALLPDLVPKDDLLGAIALGSAQYNAGRVIGPALAALVIATLGFGAAFSINAVSFFAVVAAQLAVRLPPPVRTDEAGIWSRIATGGRAAWNEPGCRSALGLVAVTAFLVAPFIALVAGRAGALVGTGESAIARATGAITTAQGVGAVIGALAVPSLAERFGRRRSLLVCLVLTPLFVTAYAWAPNLALTLVAMALLGATYIGVLSGLQAVVQLRAPAAVRGRVVSLFLVALGVLYPVGALWQGAVGDRFGLRWATLIGAAGLLVVVAALRGVWPQVLLALDVTPAEPPVPAAVAGADGTPVDGLTAAGAAPPHETTPT